MLSRVHKILIALLAAQLALAAITLTRDDERAPTKEVPLLAGLDAARVTRLQVVGPGASRPIDLVKKDGTWVLASHFDYPADPAKVTEVLAPLAAMAAAAPIATHASRHKQLRVADDEFERKLVISAGGKDTTVLVGAPAGARRTAVRLGDARVWSVTGVSAHAAGTEARSWLDASYVKIPRDQIAKIAIERAAGAAEIARGIDGTSWTISLGGTPVAPGKDETLNTAAVDRVVDELATIELAEPADPAPDTQPALATITIERKPGEAMTPAPTILEIREHDTDSYRVRERASRPVLVDKVRLEHALGISRDKLIQKAEAPPTQSSTGAAAPPTPRPG